MKAIEDYINDMRILNDPEMPGTLEPIKELHAAQLMLQDETSGITFSTFTSVLEKVEKPYRQFLS